MTMHLLLPVSDILISIFEFKTIFKCYCNFDLYLHFKKMELSVNYNFQF